MTDHHMLICNRATMFQFQMQLHTDWELEAESRLLQQQGD
jgi:hypothetical protein